MKKIKFLALLVCAIMVFVGCGATHTKPADGYFITKDLRNAKVGIVSGITDEELVRDKIPGVKIKKYKDAYAATEALKKGSVNAVVLDGFNANSILEENSDLGAMLQKVRDEKYYAAIYVPVEDRVEKGDAFLLTVDEAITKMKHTDLENELYGQYILGDDLENAAIEYNVDDRFGKVLKVGIINDNAPFSYTNANGDYVGFDVALANEIAKVYNATLELQVMDKDALLTAVENGVIDVAIGRLTDADDAHEEDWLIFSMPYFDNSQIVVLPKENVGVNPIQQ